MYETYTKKCLMVQILERIKFEIQLCIRVLKQENECMAGKATGDISENKNGRTWGLVKKGSAGGF